MKGVLGLIDGSATTGTLKPLELVRSRCGVPACSDITREMIMSIFILDRHAVSNVTHSCENPVSSQVGYIELRLFLDGP